MSLPPSVINEVRNTVVQNRLAPSAETLTPLIRAHSRVLSHVELVEAVEEVLATFAGLGPLEELIGLPNVTDILVNGPENVWIDRGEGLERTHVAWTCDDDVRNFAVRLASSANRRLDEANPFVDVRLANGIRFHALLRPLAEHTTISLRIPARKVIPLEQHVEMGTISETGSQILRDVISARVSFLVCGGTGTGKTTILGSLLSEVDERERIVVVEDSTELVIAHPHVISLQSRLANIEGLGEVNLRSLIRQSLRMRPDRIVVGEVRGVEVTDLLSALNTGHQGGCGTIHANSAESVPARIESLGLMAGLPTPAIHSELACAVQLIIEMKPVDLGRRVVSGIHVTKLNESGIVTVIPAIDFASPQYRAPGFASLRRLLN